MNIDIRTDNVLTDIQSYPDFYFHTIYADPPYNLSSQWIINKNGMPEAKGGAKDFMGKWKGLSGEDLDLFFREAYRVMKYGGYCLLFGLDRQLMPFKYFAAKHGFEECQSLYWYYMSNFPKAADASKMIDKRSGVEREVIGTAVGHTGAKVKNKQGNFDDDNYEWIGEYEITKASTDHAKLFEGYKYSISPFKQVEETIMVFRKPSKYQSILEDLMHPEDDEISPSIVNIEAGRVPFASEEDFDSARYGCSTDITGGNYNSLNHKIITGWVEGNPNGRYPANMFVDEATAKIIDDQSGEVSYGNKPGGYNYTGREYEVEGFVKNCKPKAPSNYGDTGGGSRILHTCIYEQEEIDLILYAAKVSKQERNAGCEGLELKEGFKTTGKGLGNQVRKCLIHNLANNSGDNHYSCGCPLTFEGEGNREADSNNHPTVKPISLTLRIAQLFKLPEECNQKIYIPFSGVGSEIIGVMKAGFKDIIACEGDPQWIPIAKARIEFWKTHDLTTYKRPVSKQDKDDQMNLFQLAVNQ
jgi:DNA modification methylase